jgi:hypothetical protein
MKRDFAVLASSASSLAFRNASTFAKSERRCRNAAAQTPTTCNMTMAIAAADHVTPSVMTGRMIISRRLGPAVTITPRR